MACIKLLACAATAPKDSADTRSPVVSDAISRCRRGGLQMGLSTLPVETGFEVIPKVLCPPGPAPSHEVLLGAPPPASRPGSRTRNT